MSQRGFTMIEVMITIVILSVGLMGLAGLQARGITAQKEAYQRAQALVLVNDMASRILSNRPEAIGGGYTATGASTRGKGFNGSATLDCTALTGSALDFCEWHNLLLGSATDSVTLVGARGCVYDITGSTPNTERAYLVTVAWQGYAPTAAPALDCGQNQYGANDAFRRVLTKIVTIPVLN